MTSAVTLSRSSMPARRVPRQASEGSGFDPQPLRLDPAGKRGRGRREDVARVECGKRLARSHLLGSNRDRSVDAAHERGGRPQDPVVGPDKPTLSGHDAEVSAATPYPGVDHDEMDRIWKLVHAGAGDGRALAQIEGPDLVGQVHDLCQGARAVDHCVAHTHPRVVKAEVRHERDDLLHRSSSARSDPASAALT